MHSGVCDTTTGQHCNISIKKVRNLRKDVEDIPATTKHKDTVLESGV